MKLVLYFFIGLWCCLSLEARYKEKVKRSIIEEYLNCGDQEKVCEKITPLNRAKIEKEKLKFRRIKLPSLESVKLGDETEVTLPGSGDSKVRVLSRNPLIFEVDNFVDEEDCELLIDIATAKSLKPLSNKIPDMQFKDAEQTFKEWDYDQNGVITANEVRLLPGLFGVEFTDEDVDDMFFLTKMDENKDGKVTLDEMKKADFTKANQYFQRIRTEKSRLRNITSRASWVWHDTDELLRLQTDGYFEEYHNRVAMLTGLPVEIIEESEPLQVRHFSKGQFQLTRQDSEPVDRDIPCCLYGDVGKVCRLCRYISMNIFLSDVEGGELAFPLANNKYQDVMNNSGEWRGYFIYAKTTGSKFYFQVNFAFKREGSNRIFSAQGKDESGDFSFQHGIIIGDTMKFEKQYNAQSSGDPNIKYQGKIIDGTKVSGYWWLPGQKRLRGSFFMWNRDYEIFSARAIDESNQITGCPKSSLVVKPKKGKAVFWYNNYINPKDGMVGELNQESMSGHCEVKNGEKWLATTWINVIGDGDLNLRAWRRGNNFFEDFNKTKNIMEILGTNEEKKDHENYESEYLEEITGNNKTSGDGLAGYYKHKPASNALQALNLLFNDMSMEQLRLIASNVHKKLGLTCVPLTVQTAGKVSLVDGGVE